MSCLYYNCQGLGLALTVRDLKELAKKCKPSMVFLMENQDAGE